MSGFIFNKTPKRLLNYVNLITNKRDPGWIMIPISDMMRLSHPFRFPALLKRNDSYTWSAFDDYFRSDLYKRDVPMHYGIEKVGQEWDIHVGTPLCNRSWYLEELILAGLISQEYANCKVVAIMDNLYENIPEERMYRALWHKLFSPWLRTSHLDYRYIHFIDELVDWDLFNSLKNQGKIDYDIWPAIFFDRAFFDFYRTYYRKFANSETAGHV